MADFNAGQCWLAFLLEFGLSDLSSLKNTIIEIMAIEAALAMLVIKKQIFIR